MVDRNKNKIITIFTFTTENLKQEVVWVQGGPLFNYQVNTLMSGTATVLLLDQELCYKHTYKPCDAGCPRTFTTNLYCQYCA